jgi:ornithine cyclodeaminase/alanine dehydrogenase-like protein (mu-crystallin family)
MPPLSETLALAEVALRGLGHGAEMPPKIGVHPVQPGSLAHAMPALLRGSAAADGADLMGVKWIVGFPGNPAIGLPTYQALVIVNDPFNGLPLAVMDAGGITIKRTAAVSGAAIKLFGTRLGAGAARPNALPGPQPGARPDPQLGARPATVALIGAGAQARGHLPMIGRLLAGASMRITDVDAGRAEALAASASSIDGIGPASAWPSVRTAVDGADVVISVVSFGPKHQALDPRWLGSETLFVAVDYDMQAPAALAREALFIVDERDQFLAARAEGGFDGYPDPAATLGEALREGMARPAGRVLVSHLGVGLADVVFAAAVLKRAEQLGLGVLLSR